jgi:hypothetical protein
MSLSREFYNKLTKISSELGMNPRDLLLVMYSESGLQSSIVNQDKKYGGAVGLIQFMPDTLRGLGVPKDEVKDFGKKSAEDQLDYVKKYVRGQMAFTGHPFKSASEYYHANFFPKTLKRWHGQDPIQNANTIIVSKNSPDKLEAVAYKANRGLDTDNDGHITVGDMTRVLMNSANKNGFQQALAQLNSVAGHGEVTEVAMNPELLKTKKVPPQQFAKHDSGGLEGFLQKINDFFSSMFGASGSLATAGAKSKFLIVVNAEDFTTKAEYARILQSVLDEELKISSSIHYSDDDLELTCNMPFDPQNGLDALNEVCAAVSDVFKFATRKIGGCKADTIIISGTNSMYPQMDIKISEINRRKFQFKIAQGSNVNY